MHRIIFPAMVMMVLASGVIQLPGQEPAAPAIYTAAQAEAGRTAFESTCGKCHTGRTLARSGAPGELPPVTSLPAEMQDVVRAAGGQVPPLAGADFLKVWGTRTTGELAARIKGAVGGFRPANADRDTFLNVTAYVLQANGARAGTKALDAASTVEVRSLVH